MTQSADEQQILESVSHALVRLHKEQFGRGPTRSRSYFTGSVGLVCVLQDALLPAERRLAELGERDRVLETRSAFQWATRPQFIGAVEEITGRRVAAFSSSVDPEAATVFENFLFEPEG